MPYPVAALLQVSAQSGQRSCQRPAADMPACILLCMWPSCMWPTLVARPGASCILHKRLPCLLLLLCNGSSHAELEQHTHIEISEGMPVATAWRAPRC